MVGSAVAGEARKAQLARGNVSKLEFSRGDVLAEKYEVVDLLDQSPLGFTYRVKHLSTGKYVRLLVLRPSVAGKEQKEQIVDRFKLAKELSHPHLVKVGELGEHDGLAYVTYEDFDGSTLREVLQEHKIEGRPFALKEASQIIMQILEGIAEMHRAGLVMRALRPEYVLINVRYTGPRKQTFVAQCKLVGASFWDLVPAAVLAEDEFTRGEAQYLAPELKSFEPYPSPRSDLFSAGVIFYEMLVGAAPVGTFQLPRTRRPDLPAHIDNVAELALAHAPEDRYQSATDIINDIQRTFQDQSLAEKTESKPLISPVGWGLAVVLVVFIAIILFNMGGDPRKAAEAKDSQIRVQVFEAQQHPTPADVQAVLKRHEPLQNMVYIPAGPFVAGRLHAEMDAPQSEPIAEVRETKGYLIDALEYPNIKGEKPKLNVTWKEADKLCAEQGKRLCTADEWERACKGPESKIYSYGDVYDPEFCGAGLDDPYPSGTRDRCRSGWRVFDMSGNFIEWTSTSPKEGRYIIKGGLRGNAEKGTRCAYATDQSEGHTNKAVSFRCCRDLDAPPPAAPEPQPEPTPAPEEGGSE